MTSCCPLFDCIAFATGGPDLLIINGRSDETKRLNCGGEFVACLTCSYSGKLLATCSNSKVLKIWDASSWICLGTREVPKSVTALCFTQDDTYVLAADKTGDVHSYLTADMFKDGSFLLGHLSMLLAMVITRDQKYLITADRDEKIRVSLFPNAYNIETYCLGHTEFVNCLTLCYQYEDLLISGSGDGTVRSWDFKHGILLTTEHCSKPDSKDQKSNSISCIAASPVKPVIAVAIESSSTVMIYEIRPNGSLLSTCNVVLETSPWSLGFDSSYHLWICHANETNPVVCHSWMEINSSWIRVANTDNAILEVCNKWDNFKDASHREAKWSSLRKQQIDNMESYLTRKGERLKATKGIK